MARRQYADYSGIEISSHVSGPRDARVLTVYLSMPNHYQFEESAIGRANVLAHKKGFKISEGVTIGELVKSDWDGQWKARVEYTGRWRGRSTLDRR